MSIRHTQYEDKDTYPMTATTKAAHEDEALLRGTVLRGPRAVEESAKSAWRSPQEVDDGAPPQMIALYVFVRRHGRWWISRRQNTELGHH